MNWLTGKGKVMVYGTLEKTPKGPVAAVRLAVRHRWFKWEVDVFDTVSFLLVAEKVLEANEEEDFHYNKKHGETDMTTVFPAWAMPEIKKKVAIAAPAVYEMLKRSDADIKKATENLKASLPEEVQKLLPSAPSALDKYKKLHAELNGYTLPAGREEGENKVLH